MLPSRLRSVARLSSAVGALPRLPLGRAWLHTSASRRGLEEFFTGYDQDDVGRSWRAMELRLKSSLDLRKLWFVMLKERNMLLTYRHACKARRIKMRNPHRLWKVQLTMSRIRTVLSERAIRLKLRESSRFRVKYARIRAARREARRAEARRNRPHRPVLVWKNYKPNHPGFRRIAIKRMILLKQYIQGRKDVAEGRRRKLPARLNARMHRYGIGKLFRRAPQAWRKNKEPGFVPQYLLEKRRASAIRRAESKGLPPPTDEELEEMIRLPTDFLVDEPLFAEVSDRKTLRTKIAALQKALAGEVVNPEDADKDQVQLIKELRAARRRVLELRRAARVLLKNKGKVGIRLSNPKWQGETRAYKSVLGKDYELSPHKGRKTLRIEEAARAEQLGESAKNLRLLRKQLHEQKRAASKVETHSQL